MSPSALLALSFGMSVDAFAAALGKGAALDRPRLTEALRTGMVFGVVEAITPMIGWAAGLAASAHVQAVDHWLAFLLLGGIGLHMLWNARTGAGADQPRKQRHGLRLLLATALGTSLDAMAVGVTLAFLEANILVAAAAIGLATALMATCGMLLGRLLGGRFGRCAEAFGGLALIALGASILLEHTLLA